MKDVTDVRLEKARKNHAIYKDLYQKCSERIIKTCKKKSTTGEFYVNFIISPFIPGKPLIDTRRAARYVGDKLERQGFRVRALHQDPMTMLAIEWSAPKAGALREDIARRKAEGEEEGGGLETSTSERIGRLLLG